MEKREIHFHKFFRQSNSLVETLLSRDFCQKSVRVNFCNFHTLLICKAKRLFMISFDFFFRQTTVQQKNVQQIQTA